MQWPLRRVRRKRDERGGEEREGRKAGKKAAGLYCDTVKTSVLSVVVPRHGEVDPKGLAHSFRIWRPASTSAFDSPASPSLPAL